MTDVLLLKYDIEPAKTDHLRDWLESLTDRAVDASELLEKEGMRTETLFVHATDRGDELWWYQEAEDIERVLEVYEAASGDLVEESKQLFEEVLVNGLEEPSAVLEPLVHLVGPGR